MKGFRSFARFLIYVRNDIALDKFFLISYSSKLRGFNSESRNRVYERAMASGVSSFLSAIEAAL